MVLSEDYANSGWSLDADVLALYSEDLPEPGPVSLCVHGATDMPVARALACVATKYSVVLVTGLSDTGPCVHHVSPFTAKPFPCDPGTNRTQFNSQAAFGRDGELLAKYHKRHLARVFGTEFEPWAEPDSTEVVSFKSHFGVTFGMFICNDINFGGPVRALLHEGVRDFLFPTFWINMTPWFAAIAFEDSFARAHRVNLLAANSDYMGRVSSGSGIWPANTSAPFVQHYNSGTESSGGWLGVVELTSPGAAEPIPLPMAAPEDAPALGTDGTVNRTIFFPAFGRNILLEASTQNVTCRLEASMLSGGGPYALIAEAGLDIGGWYSAKCIVVACKEEPQKTVNCDYTITASIPGGGVIFDALNLSIAAPYTNTLLPSALCSGGLAPRPRSSLVHTQGHGGGSLSLSARCPLQVAFIDGRAQHENETARCPPGGCPKAVFESGIHGSLVDASASLQPAAS